MICKFLWLPLPGNGGWTTLPRVVPPENRWFPLPHIRAVLSSESSLWPGKWPSRKERALPFSLRRKREDGCWEQIVGSWSWVSTLLPAEGPLESEVISINMVHRTLSIVLEVNSGVLSWPWVHCYSILDLSPCLGCCCLVAKLCPTLWDPVDCSSPGSSLSVGFPRQEYWSGLPFPSPHPWWLWTCNTAPGNTFIVDLPCSHGALCSGWPNFPQPSPITLPTQLIPLFG